VQVLSRVLRALGEPKTKDLTVPYHGSGERGNRSLAFWQKSQIFLRNPACSHLGQSHPNVPAVSKPYTSPSTTSLIVIPQG
jgi:hypothetical protein